MAMSVVQEVGTERGLGGFLSLRRVLPRNVKPGNKKLEKWVQPQQVSSISTLSVFE